MCDCTHENVHVCWCVRACVCESHALQEASMKRSHFLMRTKQEASLRGNKTQQNPKRREQ